MKINTDFSESVRKQVFTAFEGLKKKIETETEIILCDTQKTLDNLNTLKAEKKNVSEKEMERLHGIADAASKFLTDAYAMRRELTGALSDSGMAIPELEKKDDAAEGAEETENTETTENTESEAVTE